MGKEQIQNGETWWGFWIIVLMFFPNIVFIVWFILVNRKKFGSKDTYMKIMISGMVQLITVIRYVQISYFISINMVRILVIRITLVITIITSCFNLYYLFVLINF